MSGGGNAATVVVGRRTGSGGGGDGDVVTAANLWPGRCALPRAVCGGALDCCTDNGGRLRRRHRRWRRWCAVLMVRKTEHIWLGRRHVHYPIVMVMTAVTVFCNHKNQPYYKRSITNVHK